MDWMYGSSSSSNPRQTQTHRHTHTHTFQILELLLTMMKLSWGLSLARVSKCSTAELRHPALQLYKLIRKTACARIRSDFLEDLSKAVSLSVDGYKHLCVI
jgi:hypothetical protein